MGDEITAEIIEHEDWTALETYHLMLERATREATALRLPKPPAQLTGAERELLDSLLKQGLTRPEIAVRMDVNVLKVTRMVRIYGLKWHSRQGKEKVHIDRDLLIKYVKEGCTLKQLAKKFNVAVPTLQQKMVKLNVRLRLPHSLKQIKDKKTLIAWINGRIEQRQRQLLSIRQRIRALNMRSYSSRVNDNLADLMFESDNILEEITNYNYQIESLKQQMMMIYNSFNVYRKKVQ